MSNNKEHYHNKGEKDYAEDKGYNPPHGVIEDLVTWDKAGMQKIADENTAYKEGWTNAKKQDK